MSQGLSSLYWGWSSNPLWTWLDDHPLLYGNIGSLDPSTYGKLPTVGNYTSPMDPMADQGVGRSSTSGTRQWQR